MTTTYDPHHPRYLDEKDVRDEMTRVFDVCQGCRLCVSFCTSFPTLFDYVDRHPDRDAGRLTPAQQDQVVDECFQCKLCHVNCPYTPGRHEAAIDVPRLMLRAQAMRRSAGQVSARDRTTTVVLGRTDLIGALGSRMAPAANAVVGAAPGSIVRKVVQAATGVSAERLLPPFARQRFTTWFRERPKLRLGRRQGRVAVFPTCTVEYHEPAIGQDMVKVYERNGVECTLADTTRCCGAPYLHSGDVEQFTKVARANVKDLAATVRKGNDIVVPQPTCSYVLKKDYPQYVGGADADLVAANTYDAAEYLMALHKADGTSLDTDFTGDIPETITYHTPCHLRAQNIGYKSRDLMKLTGASVKLVQRCSGTDGLWGLRAQNAELALPMATALGEEVIRANGDVVAGDCHLANTAITEQTGREPLHPLQLLARAYGIPEE